jgi:DNA-binding beta-propeller fold protein YncE
MTLLCLIAFLAASSLAAQPAALLVVEKIAGEVGFYSLEGKRIAGVPVGRHPHEIVLSHDLRYAYVSDNGILWMTYAGEGGNTISIIDVQKHAKAGVISLGEHRRPHGMDVDPRTGRLVVTIENPNGLLLIDPASRRVLRKYDVRGEAPHMVLLDRRAERAWVSNVNSATVAAVHLESGEVDLISVDARPQGAAWSLDGRLLYVTCEEGGSIVIVDAEKKARAGLIRTGKSPARVALTPDGAILVYNLADAIGFADVASGREVATVPLGGRPMSLLLSPDGRLAWTGIQEQDKVVAVSVPDRKIVRVIHTPKGAGPDPVLPLP